MSTFQLCNKGHICIIVTFLFQLLYICEVKRGTGAKLTFILNLCRFIPLQVQKNQVICVRQDEMLSPAKTSILCLSARMVCCYIAVLLVAGTQHRLCFFLHTITPDVYLSNRAFPYTLHCLTTVEIPSISLHIVVSPVEPGSRTTKCNHDTLAHRPSRFVFTVYTCPLQLGVSVGLTICRR